MQDNVALSLLGLISWRSLLMASAPSLGLIDKHGRMIVASALNAKVLAACTTRTLLIFNPFVSFDAHLKQSVFKDTITYHT
jgi:hypothetical protein